MSKDTLPRSVRRVIGWALFCAPGALFLAAMLPLAPPYHLFAWPFVDAALVIAGITLERRMDRERRYMDAPDDVCCCGDPMEGHGAWSGHTPKSMLAWAKECEARRG